MRLLVCGSRTYSDTQKLVNVLDAVRQNRGRIDVLIEGGATGADTMARLWAEHQGIPVLSFPPDWQKHGKSAGPIRNQEMLDVGKPDTVVCFVEGEDLTESKGTTDMFGRAEKAGLEVHVIYNDRMDLH